MKRHRIINRYLMSRERIKVIIISNNNDEMNSKSRVTKK